MPIHFTYFNASTRPRGWYNSTITFVSGSRYLFFNVWRQLPLLLLPFLCSSSSSVGVHRVLACPIFQVQIQSPSFLASVLWPNANLRPDGLDAGNLPELFQSQAGVPDFKYQQIYGDVVRIKGPFGVWQLLYLSNSIGEIHQVYRKIVCSFLILKPCNIFFTFQVGIFQRFFNETPDRAYYRVSFFEMARKNRDFPHFNGSGSSVGGWWTHTASPVRTALTIRAGDIHKRQRKVMLPGFGGRLWT